MSVRKNLIVRNPNYVNLARGITPSSAGNAPAVIVTVTISQALEVMGIHGRDVLSLLDAGAAAENIALGQWKAGSRSFIVRSATTGASCTCL